MFLFDENPIFYPEFERKIIVFRWKIVGKKAKTEFYL